MHNNEMRFAERCDMFFFVEQMNLLKAEQQLNKEHKQQTLNIYN